MKKLLIVASALLVALNVVAETKTLFVTTSGYSNVLSGPVKITQFVLTSSATNYATLRFYDAPGNSTIYTNPATIDVQTYATNLITTYTNFFGVTNSITNLVIVDIARTNVATTNTYDVRMVATVPTNTTQVIDGVNYYFQNGVLVSNIAGGYANFTITYQK